MKILTESPAQTKKIAQIFAKESLDLQGEKALVVGLEGDLGGGKTTFVQGLAKGLGIKEKVLSPTFNIFKKFKINKKGKIKRLYHFDCYRIEKSEEILGLGFDEIILDSANMVVIEWSDRIKEILPKDTVIFKFEFKGENEREIEAGKIKE